MQVLFSVSILYVSGYISGNTTKYVILFIKGVEPSFVICCVLH